MPQDKDKFKRKKLNPDPKPRQEEEDVDPLVKALGVIDEGQVAKSIESVDKPQGKYSSMIDQYDDDLYESKVRPKGGYNPDLASRVTPQSNESQGHRVEREKIELDARNAEFQRTRGPMSKEPAQTGPSEEEFLNDPWAFIDAVAKELVGHPDPITGPQESDDQKIARSLGAIEDQSKSFEANQKRKADIEFDYGTDWQNRKRMQYEDKDEPSPELMAELRNKVANENAGLPKGEDIPQPSSNIPDEAAPQTQGGTTPQGSDESDINALIKQIVAKQKGRDPNIADVIATLGFAASEGFGKAKPGTAMAYANSVRNPGLSDPESRLLSSVERMKGLREEGRLNRESREKISQGQGDTRINVANINKESKGTQGPSPTQQIAMFKAGTKQTEGELTRVSNKILSLREARLKDPLANVPEKAAAYLEQEQQLSAQKYDLVRLFKQNADAMLAQGLQVPQPPPAVQAAFEEMIKAQMEAAQAALQANQGE